MHIPKDQEALLTEEQKKIAATITVLEKEVEKLIQESKHIRTDIQAYKDKMAIREHLKALEEISD
tara:strand:+ start:129 stop:323 length:195 start_codon:yes stop_codon:yes gene_type:complete